MSGQFSNQFGTGKLFILAKQESWTEHQEHKLHKENLDKLYDYHIEFTKYLCFSANLWVGENRNVSGVSLLEWDAESGTSNDIVISGVSKSVCVHLLDFNADYVLILVDLQFGSSGRFFYGRVSQIWKVRLLYHGSCLTMN